MRVVLFFKTDENAAVLSGFKVRTMRAALGLALSILAGLQLAAAQSRDLTEKEQIQTVNFCDLTKYPDRYDGKTVQVSATYVSDLEGAIFFDDTCKKSESQPDVIAKPKFIGSSDEVKRSLNQLKKVFDKRFVAPHLARVTMIAVFRVRDASIISSDPRYTLEVKRFIDVEKAKP
jgi:hypothetical protein